MDYPSTALHTFPETREVRSLPQRVGGVHATGPDTRGKSPQPMGRGNTLDSASAVTYRQSQRGGRGTGGQRRHRRHGPLRERTRARIANGSQLAPNEPFCWEVGVVGAGRAGGRRVNFGPGVQSAGSIFLFQQNTFPPKNSPFCDVLPEDLTYKEAGATPRVHRLQMHLYNHI